MNNFKMLFQFYDINLVFSIGYISFCKHAQCGNDIIMRGKYLHDYLQGEK